MTFAVCARLQTFSHISKLQNKMTIGAVHLWTFDTYKDEKSNFRFNPTLKFLSIQTTWDFFQKIFSQQESECAHRKNILRPLLYCLSGFTIFSIAGIAIKSYSLECVRSRTKFSLNARKSFHDFSLHIHELIEECSIELFNYQLPCLPWLNNKRQQKKLLDAQHAHTWMNFFTFRDLNN